jgi:galactitol-specific phosphotransferase system IIB component
MYYIEPVVSVEWGDNIIVNTSVHPPIVKKLHVNFLGWSGDDIIETFPCFIISEKLKKVLEHDGITGYEIENLEVTKSKQFLDAITDVKLPLFYWLKIVGEKNKDDIFLKNNMMTISDKTLKSLQKVNIDNADVYQI